MACGKGEFCCYSVAKSCPTLENPWTAACQAPLSFTSSPICSDSCPLCRRCLSHHLILCHPLLLKVAHGIRIVTNWPWDGKIIPDDLCGPNVITRVLTYERWRQMCQCPHQKESEGGSVRKSWPEWLALQMERSEYPRDVSSLWTRMRLENPFSPRASREAAAIYALWF